MKKGSFEKYKDLKIFHYNIIDSTQKEIERRIKNKTIENKTIITADIQTSGIGTRGRVWHTDEKNNIALSIYLDFNEKKCLVDKLDGITIKIAKNIVKTFEELYGIKLNIKYPNDIYFNGKKLGGILTESKIQDKIVKCLVIGIGININQMNFKDDIKDIATSIKKEFKIDIDIKRLKYALFNCILASCPKN